MVGLNGIYYGSVVVAIRPENGPKNRYQRDTTKKVYFSHFQHQAMKKLGNRRGHCHSNSIKYQELNRRIKYVIYSFHIVCSLNNNGKSFSTFVVTSN